MSANTSAPHRSQLLSGLRTGGVRSAANIPHTAAPGATFNIPRVPSGLQAPVFSEEDDIQGQYAQNVFLNPQLGQRTMPMTAIDGPNNRFLQQQQHNVNTNVGSFSPAFSAQPNHVQAQALQMQMMQLEILRMQTLQAQQYQAQMLAAQQPQSARRPNFNPPATAGPTTGSFDLRSTALSAQMRRSQPHEELQVPMTAALGGKFGVRSGPMGRFGNEDHEDLPVPHTPNATSVISGGTSLGAAPTPASTPSKSDSASTWRRGGNNNSVLRGANRPSLGGKTSPPPSERRSSPPPAAPVAASLGKFRPQPLSFNGAVSQPVPALAIDSSEGENDDGYSTSSSDSVASNSPPTTPRSSSSERLSVSPPKDAINIKVMANGLGLGHPISASPPKASHRVASQPMRQPRGPPSGPDELGSRNFAARLVPRLIISVA
ncbi:hypothetical protein R3P38DRAFT_2824290 [Favolaschia claudopus]|uniref:Uncharacterized protein n=1 Tax=Favolaschia claudopus TaxID=2862362 RepID=A0AAW0EG55_9AGAR